MIVSVLPWSGLVFCVVALEGRELVSNSDRKRFGSYLTFG